MELISIESLKAMKKLCKNSYAQLPDDIINELMDAGYVYSNTVIQDTSGLCVGDGYTVTRKGRAYIESQRIFSVPYIFKNILVPILVGVGSSIITTLLLTLL